MARREEAEYPSWIFGRRATPPQHRTEVERVVFKACCSNAKVERVVVNALLQPIAFGEVDPPAKIGNLSGEALAGVWQRCSSFTELLAMLLRRAFQPPPESRALISYL